MKRAEQQLANFLHEKKLTVAFAESVTCGMAAHKLGTVSGTSTVFCGSIVCYDEHIKTGLLNVSKIFIEKHTAESQEVTDILCKNLKGKIKADVHAAVTGLAAPGGSETKLKPVGTVFYSVLVKNNMHRLRKLFKGSPLEIREKACKEMFRFILKAAKMHTK